MAAIEVQIDRKRDLTVFSVTGELSAAEILEMAREYYVGSPTQLVLWDVTRGSLRSIATQDVRAMAVRMKSLARKREHGRTALVGDLVAYGVGRMYEAFTELESLPVAFRVFRTREEALRWLDVNESATFDEGVIRPHR